MNKTALSLAMGAAMTTGVALADGPVPLTEAQLDSVTAAGFGFVNFQIDIEKFKTIDIDVLLNVNQTVNFAVEGTGFLADAEAVANCSFPTDCKATTLSGVDVNVDRFFAEEGLPQVTSISESLAAAPSLSGLAQ